MSALCGAEHPSYDLNFWTCDRPAGHEGKHATMVWEDWEDPGD